MNCPSSGTLQDHLEGLLADDERVAIELHAATCDRCIVELARLDSLFARLGGLPLESPAPGLADRVLDQLMPARRRERWLKRLGIGYAASLGATLAGAGIWMSQPAVRSFASWAAAETSAHLFHGLMFLVNTASFVAINLAGGWGIVNAVGSRVTPLARALLAVADKGLVQAALAVAALLALGIVWSLRSRSGRSGKGMPHVGLLGF